MLKASRGTSLRISLVAAIVAILSLGASPAFAVPVLGGPAPVTESDTEMVMTGTAEGQAVAGAVPSSGAVSDPSVAYPATPPAGHVADNVSFAGVITGESADGGTQLKLYCIDLNTTTYAGIGYVNGSWAEAGMPNVGYVARLLNEYYPSTGEPAGAPNDNARAAAVQAAIWYFTDYFVLQATDPIRPYVEAIVNAVRVQPPLPNPTPPSLSISPETATGIVESVAGPFTINTTAPSGAELTVTGGTMYSDAAGLVPIASGTVVMDGQQVWLRADDPSVGASVTLSARGSATMPSGNVYIYDQNTPGVTDAQRLILAETVQLETAVEATAVFQAAPVGALTVVKSIVGTGAGLQGESRLHVSCTNGIEQDVVAAARTTGSVSTTISDIPIGTSCTITEPLTGANAAAEVTTAGLATVVIADTGGVTVTVTNTYSRVLAVSGTNDTMASLVSAFVLLAAGGGLIALRRRFA